MCDFDGLRKHSLSGQTVLEASRYDVWPPTENCIAAFLAAAKPYMYMSRLASDPEVFDAFTEHSHEYPLGDPHSAAVEVHPGVFRRRFGPVKGAPGTKVTEVWWDNNLKVGS